MRRVPRRRSGCGVRITDCSLRWSRGLAGDDRSIGWRSADSWTGGPLTTASGMRASRAAIREMPASTATSASHDSSTSSSAPNSVPCSWLPGTLRTAKARAATSTHRSRSAAPGARGTRRATVRAATTSEATTIAMAAAGTARAPSRRTWTNGESSRCSLRPAWTSWRTAITTSASHQASRTIRSGTSAETADRTRSGRRSSKPTPRAELAIPSIPFSVQGRCRPGISAVADKSPRWRQSSGGRGDLRHPASRPFPAGSCSMTAAGAPEASGLGT